MISILLTPFLLAAGASAPLAFEGAAELFEKGRVSTATATEIRIAFSPDGTRMLWGTIGREGGAGGWDLWESKKRPEGLERARSRSRSTRRRTTSTRSSRRTACTSSATARAASAATTSGSRRATRGPASTARP